MADEPDDELALCRLKKQAKSLIGRRVGDGSVVVGVIDDPVTGTTLVTTQPTVECVPPYPWLSPLPTDFFRVDRPETGRLVGPDGRYRWDAVMDDRTHPNCRCVLAPVGRPSWWRRAALWIARKVGWV